MKISRRITAVLLAAALLLCAVPALFASAATVIPRAVQIQWRDEWKDDYYGTMFIMVDEINTFIEVHYEC